MINDDPDARDLVAIALKSFRETILPVVPADRRFTALMIANALGIAERELATGAAGEPALVAAIGGLSGETGTLADLLPRLCAGIEAGAFDAPDRQTDLRAVLTEITRARVAVSNPKLLTTGTPSATASS